MHCDVPMMKQGWHGVFEWCCLFQVLTFDSLGSCTSTDPTHHHGPKPMPVPFLQLFSILIPSTNHNQLESSRVGPASPETPSLNLRTVGLAVLLPPKSPGTAKDRTASHQHLRVAIRFRWCLRFSKEPVDSLSVLSVFNSYSLACNRLFKIGAIHQQHTNSSVHTPENIWKPIQYETWKWWFRSWESLLPPQAMRAMRCTIQPLQLRARNWVGLMLLEQAPALAC